MQERKMIMKQQMQVDKVKEQIQAGIEENEIYASEREKAVLDE